VHRFIARLTCHWTAVQPRVFFDRTLLQDEDRWLMQDRFLLAQTDAVAWLRGLPAESVDLVVTDPPYESLEKHRAVGTTTRLKHSKASSNDWFAIFENARFPALFAELFRVLRRNRHLYLFCDAETMFAAKPVAEAAGSKGSRIHVRPRRE
jgi:DNA modification methylase